MFIIYYRVKSNVFCEFYTLFLQSKAWRVHLDIQTHKLGVVVVSNDGIIHTLHVVNVCTGTMEKILK